MPPVQTEVYALARWLGLPRAVCDSTPTTDTYTLPQGQDEFFFALPYQQMDHALWAHDHGVPPVLTATRMGLAPELINNVYRDIEAKRRSAHYLHAPPLMLEDDARAAQDPVAARAPA